MLVVTLTGILLGAAILGLVSSAIDRRLDNLRRGRSLVVEEGHTLILGDSDKVTAIISELIEANASERDTAVVVLTAEDTVDVSDAIRTTIKDFKTTRLVVRSGQSTRLADLEQGNPATAKSIIVLRSDSDARVVKASLGALRCLDAASTTRVIAELDDPEIARALASATDGRVIPVTSGEVVALIGAQVARAPGLGAIYEDLLDFDGDEFYMTAVPGAWVGKTFGQALLGSSRGTIIGLRFADGSTVVAPELSTALSQGDSLIGIAEDDSTFALDIAPTEWRPDSTRAWEPLARTRERTLLIGWSSMAPRMCREIDRHVAVGSERHLLVDRPDEEVEAIRMAMTLENQSLTIHLGDPVAQGAVHAALDAGPFNHVLLLSEHEGFDRDEADARTLLALLHVHS
ncbi:MAG: CASTOR/POLLUX-related putative ion channel, partial [Actinomycetota bacterium]